MGLIPFCISLELSQDYSFSRESFLPFIENANTMPSSIKFPPFRSSSLILGRQIP